MREINTHKVNGCNDAITLVAADQPGIGGANHEYLATFPVPTNPGAISSSITVSICFQNGPIREAGINGLTHEVLLAILADRLQGFQSGPYACDDNAKALNHILAAQAILQDRTKARLARGVEGTRTV